MKDKNPKPLSAEMQRVLAMLSEYGCLVRYKGGFWHKENAEMEPLSGGGRSPDGGQYPPGYCGTLTIQALLKRDLIKVDESKPINMFRTFPVKVSLKKEANEKKENDKS